MSDTVAPSSQDTRRPACGLASPPKVCMRRGRLRTLSRKRRRGLQFTVAEAEGVPLTDIAGFEATAEPADALGGGAVREGVGDDVALRFLLQPVVADGIGGAERLFDIARLEDLEAALGMVRPDAGV